MLKPGKYLDPEGVDFGVSLAQWSQKLLDSNKRV